MRVFKKIFSSSSIFILLTVSVFVFSLFILQTPQVSYAANSDIGCTEPEADDTCTKFDKAPDQLQGGFQFGDVSSDKNSPNYGFKGITGGIIAAGGGIIGGLAVLKVIFGGFLYATAAGNPKMIGEAKSHITYALIGIALLVGMNIVLFMVGADY